MSGMQEWKQFHSPHNLRRSLQLRVYGAHWFEAWYQYGIRRTRVQLSKKHYRCPDLRNKAVLKDIWRVEGVQDTDRIILHWVVYHHHRIHWSVSHCLGSKTLQGASRWYELSYHSYSLRSLSFSTIIVISTSRIRLHTACSGNDLVLRCRTLLSLPRHVLLPQSFKIEIYISSKLWKSDIKLQKLSRNLQNSPVIIRKSANSPALKSLSRWTLMFNLKLRTLILDQRQEDLRQAPVPRGTRGLKCPAKYTTQQILIVHKEEFVYKISCLQALWFRRLRNHSVSCIWILYV